MWEKVRGIFLMPSNGKNELFPIYLIYVYNLLIFKITDRQKMH